jgi:hypothetical protein
MAIQPNSNSRVPSQLIGFHSALFKSDEKINLQKDYLLHKNISENLIFSDFQSLISFLERQQGGKILIENLDTLAYGRVQTRQRILALTKTKAEISIGEWPLFTSTGQYFLSMFIDNVISQKDLIEISLSPEAPKTCDLATFVLQYSNYESECFNLPCKSESESQAEWKIFHSSSLSDYRYCYDEFLISAKKGLN